MRERVPLPSFALHVVVRRRVAQWSLLNDIRNSHIICSLRYVAVPIEIHGWFGEAQGSRRASIGKAREPLVVEKRAAARSER